MESAIKPVRLAQVFFDADPRDPAMLALDTEGRMWHFSPGIGRWFPHLMPCAEHWKETAVDDVGVIERIDKFKRRFSIPAAAIEEAS